MKKTRLLILFLCLITGLLLLFLLRQTKVLNSSPLPQTTNVDLSLSPSFTFNRRPNPDTLSIITFPNFDFATSWNNKTLLLQPTAPLAPLTTYKITLFSNQAPIYTLAFQTRPYNQSEIKQFGAEQVSNDFDFGQAQAKAYQEKPFLSALPIVTPDFVAAYNSQLDKIRLQLKTSPPDPKTKQTLIDSALSELLRRGVNATQIGYYILETNTP